MDDDAEQCAGPDLTLCHPIGDLHGFCAVAYCGLQPAQADALMALNLPTSMGAQLATDADRFSAFWEARRERAPGLRDQLAREKGPERPAFSTSALVDPCGDPI